MPNGGYRVPQTPRAVTVAHGSFTGLSFRLVTATARCGRGPSMQGKGEPMGRSVNWGCMSHVVPGSSWLLAHDTRIVPGGAGLAGWVWAE